LNFAARAFVKAFRTYAIGIIALLGGAILMRRRRTVLRK